MKKRRDEIKGVTRREFLGKAFFPTVAFGFLTVTFGKFLPREKARKTEKPNTSLKEASQYSRLAG